MTPITAKELIEENLQTQNPVLDLSYCDLNGTEDVLFETLNSAQHIHTLILNPWCEYTSLGQKSSAHTRDQHQGKPNCLQKVPGYLPPKLKRLILNGYPYEDWDEEVWYNQHYKALKNLPELVELHLSFTHINDFSFLSHLKKLKILNLSNTVLKDYSFLKDLPSLEILDISDTPIVDLSYMDKLPLLKVLMAHTLGQAHQAFEDISFLQRFPQIEVLQLSTNSIEEITVLRNLTQLTQLNLSYNPIKDFSTLSILVQLRDLNLRKTNLKHLDDLEQLSKLNSLDISNNDIQEITLEFLNQFEDLEKLIFEANPLENLPRRFQGYHNLGLSDLKEHLIKEQNKAHSSDLEPIFIGDEEKFWQLFYSIDETDIAFALEIAEGLPEINLDIYLDAYKVLYQYIHDKKIKHITIKQMVILNAPKQVVKNHKTFCPPEIGILQNLTHLEINSKIIKKLPTELRQLPNLMTLKVSNGALNSIPYELSNLTNLYHLELDGNQFLQIPQEIIYLENLERLKLNKNQIHEIPSSIVMLQKLRDLDLSDNLIKEIPDQLFELQNLTFINLSRNPMPESEISKLKKRLPHCMVYFH